MEVALRGALLHLGVKEGHLDSKHRPILVDGFRYEDSVMRGVEYVADEGGTYWKDYTEHKPRDVDPNQVTLDLDLADETPAEQVARVVADTLGYTSVANCMAMFREGVKEGLLDATHVDGMGWLTCSEYGWEQLFMWEDLNNDTY